MLCPEKSRISAKDAFNNKWIKSRLKKKNKILLVSIWIKLENLDILINLNNQF